MRLTTDERELLQQVIDDLLCINQNSLSGDDLYHIRLAIGNLKDLRDDMKKQVLVDVTENLTPRIGLSGWDEKDKKIYHIQLVDDNNEVVANVDNRGVVIIDDKYFAFTTEEDFRIMKKI